MALQPSTVRQEDEVRFVQREREAQRELLSLLASSEANVPWQSARAELHAILARLRDLEQGFDEALERAKLDALREFAYGASHEINNPLANISSRAQTLLRDEADPERRRKLATINSQAFRAHEMIADLMLFAKPPSLVLEAVDLAAVVEQVVRQLEERTLEQGTRLVVEGTNSACVIEADLNHLATAVKALCQNALEAVVQGGCVTVSLDRPGQEGVSLSVEDTGAGIPPEQRRHLFDPFFSGREAGRGLGLGLSKCWRIVTLHGGLMDVQSRHGLGARFTIHLPVRSPTPTHA